VIFAGSDECFLQCFDTVGCIRWMRGVKIAERFSCSALRERLGIDDIITLIQ